jgi:hypothetical protein
MKRGLSRTDGGLTVPRGGTRGDRHRVRSGVGNPLRTSVAGRIAVKSVPSPREDPFLGGTLTAWQGLALLAD